MQFIIDKFVIFSLCLNIVNLEYFKSVSNKPTKIIFVRNARTEKKVHDIAWNMYFNNKIDFIHFKVMNTIEDVYRDLMLNDCRLNREILQTKMALVATNPDMTPPAMPLAD